MGVTCDLNKNKHKKRNRSLEILFKLFKVYKFII